MALGTWGAEDIGAGGPGKGKEDYSPKKTLLGPGSVKGCELKTLAGVDLMVTPSETIYRSQVRGRED